MARQATLFQASAQRRNVPLTPSLFVGANEAPEKHPDMAALARRIVELQDKAKGLRVSPTPAACYYPDLDMFPGFNVYRLEASGDELWIATAAIQDRSAEDLERAIQAAKVRA